MKLFTTLCVALLAFIAGILITRGGEQRHPATRAEQTRTARPAQPELSGEMELKFIRFISNQYHTYAQLEVTNGSPETVRFPGGATNSNSMLFIRQGDWLTPPLDKQWAGGNWGKHWGTQRLLSGETVTFDLRVPDDKNDFEIGFAYEVGAEHEWKIVWSGKIEHPAR